MKRHKVSVIVPVYGVREFLPACIESILNQTFTDLELILVDDESPDGCGAICDEYACRDPRVKVIHKTNGGVSSARNAGLDVADGEYIAFCDSDDYWDTSFLSVMVDAAEREKLDMVSCGYRRVGPDGASQRCVFPPTIHRFTGWEDRQQYLHSTLLLYKEGWEVWDRLFRTEIIEKNRIRFCTTCGNFAEDLGFVAQYVMYASSIQMIGECLYNYTIRENSMMSQSRPLVRLDELNEISFQIGTRYSAQASGKNWRQHRALTHFLVMYNQYIKVIRAERYRELPALVKKIQNKSWFKKNTIAIFGTYRLLKTRFGKGEALQVLLFSSYCLHGSGTLYRLSKRLLNSFIRWRQR